MIRRAAFGASFGGREGGSFLLLIGSVVLVACGTQFTDPILRGVLAPDGSASEDAQPVLDSGLPPDSVPAIVDSSAADSAEREPAVEDRCGQWSTSATCLADTAHGCSFQPNPVGCHVGDPTCAAGTCLGGDPFVRRSGATLWLHGGTFTFVGAVSWGVAGANGIAGGCRYTSYPTQGEMLTRTFDDLADMKVTALRIWAFQSSAGPSGADYTGFEQAIAYARRAGVRLIMVLENFYGDCTQGGQRDDAWFASGYRARYGSYALSYSDYVRGLVTHFRDEPTILAWELMHEAGGNDFATMDGFSQDMSSQIRAADPNHLIALGVNNGDNPTTSPATSSAGEPSNYEKLHEHPDIDLFDSHDLHSPDVATTDAMMRDQNIAAAVGKPIFVGASAIPLAGTSAGAFAARADAMNSKLARALDSGFVGFLIYDYYPAWQDFGWEFDGRSEDPLGGASGIMALQARHNR